MLSVKEAVSLSVSHVSMGLGMGTKDQRRQRNEAIVRRRDVRYTAGARVGLYMCETDRPRSSAVQTHIGLDAVRVVEVVLEAELEVIKGRA